MLKDLLYTGIGAAAVIKEKIEEEMKVLEEKGKIKSDDAKSFINSIKEKGQEEDKKIKEQFKSMIKEIIDDLEIATKKDLQQLKEDLK